MQQRNAYCINGALSAAGMPNNLMPEAQFSEDPQYTRDNIKSGNIKELFWFRRQALTFCSDHKSVGRFNDVPAIEHHQVLDFVN